MSLYPYFIREFLPDSWRRPVVLRSSSVVEDSAKHRFQLCVDVHQFAPDEIKVKTLDGSVVVECEHDERRDEHGYVWRKFVRRYQIPEGVAPEDVVSSLSSDGVLTITAPREPIPLADENERIVPIIQEGPVGYAVRDHRVEHERPHHHHNHHHVAKEPEVILAIKYI